jgi:hypothetical protein
MDLFASECAAREVAIENHRQVVHIYVCMYVCISYIWGMLFSVRSERGRYRKPPAGSTQFTCFTGTKVQVLTLAPLLRQVARRQLEIGLLRLY